MNGQHEYELISNFSWRGTVHISNCSDNNILNPLQFETQIQLVISYIYNIFNKDFPTTFNRLYSFKTKYTINENCKTDPPHSYISNSKSSKLACMRAAPKVLPLILPYWAMMSEVDIAGMAVEAEFSCQYSITLCFCTTDGSREAV